MTKKLLIAIVLLTLNTGLFAVIEQSEFDNPKLEQRYKSLIDELRCLVCQNQNLAESDAPLAKDLRTITANMLREGASDREVKQFMRDRYGDFVLYKPPFNASTAFLWLGPLLLLVSVLVMLFIRIRRREHDDILKPAHADNETERVKVRNLLRDSPKLDSENTKQG